MISRPFSRSVVALAAASLAFVPAARAHTPLVGTSPSRGAVVAHLPATLRLTFGQPIRSVRSVVVLDLVLRGNHTVSARRNPKNATQVLVRTRTDRVSRYRVTWTVVALDGHTERGSFTFRVRR